MHEPLPFPGVRACAWCTCMHAATRQLYAIAIIAKTKSGTEFRRSVGRSHYPSVDPSWVHKSVEYG